MMSWNGFSRPDWEFGIRNYIVVMLTVEYVNFIARRIDESIKGSYNTVS